MNQPKFLFVLVAIAMASSSTVFGQITVSNKTQPGPAQNFQGSVLVQRLAIDTTDKWMVSRVVFKPRSWSRWHTHPGKQVIIATDGEGYLKLEGQPLRKLHKGDLADIQPGVRHWHGSTANLHFVQLVVNPDTKSGIVTWMEPVTELQYNELKNQ